MSSTAEQIVRISDQPPAPVRWTWWPAGRRPVATTVVLLALAAAGWLAAEVTGRAHLGWLTAVVLALALWRFFLPVRYELNADGLQRWVLGRRKEIPWEAIRSFRVDRTGVLLLPFSETCPADVLRGEFLPWGGHREEILAFLEHYVEGGRRE